LSENDGTQASAEAQTRTRLVALAILLALAVPLVVIALVSGDSDEDAGLRVERFTSQAGTTELRAYVEGDANRPDVAGGRRTVNLECTDRSGEAVVTGTFPWPFVDTDQGTIEPHVHQPVTERESRQLVRCRLRGTDPPLAGRVVEASLR
jgi:hypothetical protein